MDWHFSSTKPTSLVFLIPLFARVLIPNCGCLNTQPIFRSSFWFSWYFVILRLLPIEWTELIYSLCSSWNEKSLSFWNWRPIGKTWKEPFLPYRQANSCKTKEAYTTDKMCWSNTSSSEDKRFLTAEFRPLNRQIYKIRLENVSFQFYHGMLIPCSCSFKTVFKFFSKPERTPRHLSVEIETLHSLLIFRSKFKFFEILFSIATLFTHAEALIFEGCTNCRLPQREQTNS